MNTQWAVRVLSGEDKSFTAGALRLALGPASQLYGLGVAGYWALYRFGLLRRVKLPCPVVSVGNITVGGTGKTAAVRFLARGLQQRGLRPAVLSYGYHGGGLGEPRWVSQGRERLLSPAECGDEAALLADSLPGVPVVVGSRRADSGRMVCSHPWPPDQAPQVLLLDDGFQYWRLHRDLDLVLIDATNPFGYDQPLPRGLLREPMGALARADGFLLTRCDQVEAPEAVEGITHRLARANPSAPTWRSSYAPRSLTSLSESSEELPLDHLRGLPVATLSSLGNPASFEATVQACGATLVHAARFPDHHLYTEDEVALVVAQAITHGAQAIVVSDKDAVKIREFSRRRWPLPLHRLNAELAVDGGDDLLDRAAAVLRQSSADYRL
ncbi:MAG TPA: tetraacyldisaccharide 4'-kinase [Armatimonadota bacterium]|jgi:tetraacyldisaccharide 4'-kinase